MKRIYRDPHTGAVVNVLPITYPFPNRVVTTDVNPDGSECCCHTTAKPRNNSSIAGAPKVVAGAQMQGLRGLLTRWSGHIPVKEKYDKGQLVPIPIDDAKPAPLTTDERQVGSWEFALLLGCMQSAASMQSFQDVDPSYSCATCVPGFL